MKDYYNILGIEKTASADDVKKAYRKLAMKHHPDRGGDTEKFKEIEEAYRTLGDPQKRTEYDNPYSGIHINVNHGGPFGFDTNNSYFNDVFRRHFGQQHTMQQRLTLWIGLDTAIRGGKQIVAVAAQQGKSTIEINIPVAVEDGISVRYPGIAAGGSDLIVTFRIHPHPKWERKGLDLWTTVDADFWQLIIGATSTVNTITGGSLNFTIPPKTNPGSVLRLKGQGISTAKSQGDLYVRLQAIMPAHIPNEIIELLKNRVN